MKTLFILNDGPYGSERSDNGLRLAGALCKVAGEEVKMLLIGDAAACAKTGQKVPEGFYNVQLMFDRVTKHGGPAGVCGSCLDVRGITESELAGEARRSTLNELAEWTGWADKAVVL